jgi:hypothetical protein
VKSREVEMELPAMVEMQRVEPAKVNKEKENIQNKTIIKLIIIIIIIKDK